MKQKGCGIIHVHWKLGIVEKLYCGRSKVVREIYIWSTELK